MSGIIVLIIRFLLAVALYAFFGIAIYALWREMRAQSQALTARKIPSITLANLDAEQEHPTILALPEIVIGRDDICEYVVKDDTVSARHARFSYKQQQWWLEDLQSTNGTFLNDTPVQTSTVIMTGDLVRVGQVHILLTIESSDQAKGR